MLCSKCHKKEATVYYKQNINGEIREYALCSECAAQSEPGFAPLNLFSTVLGSTPVKHEPKRCTLCTSTLDQIRSSGKAGCAECYSVFADELEPMIRGIHRGASYKGRCPGEATVTFESENELDNLRNQLKAAIEAEEYEKAAQLRDLIKEKEAEK